MLSHTGPTGHRSVRDGHLLHVPYDGITLLPFESNETWDTEPFGSHGPLLPSASCQTFQPHWHRSGTAKPRYGTPACGPGWYQARSDFIFSLPIWQLPGRRNAIRLTSVHTLHNGFRLPKVQRVPFCFVPEVLAFSALRLHGRAKVVEQEPSVAIYWAWPRSQKVDVGVEG